MVSYGGVLLMSLVAAAAAGSDDWTTHVRPLSLPHFQPAMCTLHDGRVLVAGGNTGSDDHSTFAKVQVWDPVKNSWSAGPPLKYPRTMHAMAVMKDGRVLVAGGTVYNTGSYSVQELAKTTEIYDPSHSHGGWVIGPNMTVPRSGLALVSTPDGGVLAMGGTNNNDQWGDGLKTIERLVLASDGHGEWVPVDTKLLSGRWLGNAALLKNGSVAVAGGRSAQVEILKINLTTGGVGPSNWGAPMTITRKGFGFVELLNGSLFAAGGYSGAADLETAEVFAGNRWVRIQPMHAKRPGCRAALLHNGSVLVAGASVRSGSAKSGAAKSVELYGTSKFRCILAPNSTRPSCRPSPDGGGTDIFTCNAVCG